MTKLFSKETGKCCFCGGEYSHYGNSPYPIRTSRWARCCDKCNWERVLPARGLNPGITYEQYLETVKSAYTGDKCVYEEEFDEQFNGEYISCPVDLLDLYLDDLRAASALSSNEAKSLIDRAIKFGETCKNEHTFTL